MPSTLTKININAFTDSGIKKAIIPEGVKKLDGAYLRCHELTTVSLPKSLMVLKDFNECKSIKDVYLHGVPEQYDRWCFEGSKFNLHLVDLEPDEKLEAFIERFDQLIKKIYVKKNEVNKFKSALSSYSSLISTEIDGNDRKM